MRIHLRQETPDGPLETTLVKELVVLPAADQVIFADQYGENWTQGFISNVEVDEQVFAGTWAQALVAEAFTLEYKPLTPVEPVGYRACGWPSIPAMPKATPGLFSMSWSMGIRRRWSRCSKEMAWISRGKNGR